MRYIITYGLAAPGQNYDQLIRLIKSYPKWAHITESSWAIITTESRQEVRDYLVAALDRNDKLLVGDLHLTAWTGLNKEVAAWLKANAD